MEMLGKTNIRQLQKKTERKSENKFSQRTFIRK